MAGSTNEEAEVRSWGFSHVFTWTDPPNAHYSPHKHSGLTAHLILDGEMTVAFLEDERCEKKVYGVGEKIEVEPQRLHEVWVGKDGCTYVIGEE